MSTSVRGWLLVAAALALCGCAAQSVTEISIAQPGDDALDCTALKQQIADDLASEKSFIHGDSKVASDNTTKIVLGSAIPYVGLLAIATADLSNAEQVKARALADRIEHLAYLAKQKGCPE